MAKSASRQQFIEQNAQYAMEQMKRYGIPASVTLAQACVESGDGHSYLAEHANNYFGIKGTFNGQYELRKDDHHYPEKFRKYDNVAQSYEDHSKVLNASRYTKNTSNISLEDPECSTKWVVAIKKGGYASHPGYVKMLTDVIKDYDLEKYDKQVLAEMKGKQWGVKANPIANVTNPTNLEKPNVALHPNILGNSEKYYFPMTNSQNLLVVTSGFGVDRGDHHHGGLDFRAQKPVPLYATENNGKVIKVDNTGNGAAGKYVTVEYERANGEKLRCTYMHMASVNVAVGDTVQAGNSLGVSGNTGRSTAPHLHFETSIVMADGKTYKIDPREYLAAMQLKANIPTEVREKGTSKDMLAEYKAAMTTDPIHQQQYAQQQDETLDPDQWMKEMMLSDERNAAYQQDGDLISKIIELLISLFMMATLQDKNSSRAQQIENAANVAMNRSIDLSAYCPKQKEVTLSVSENNNAVLRITNEEGKVTEQTLTREEVAHLTSIAKSDADIQQKGAAINNMVNRVVLTQQASQNFDNMMEQQQTQQQEMRR